MSLVWPSRPLRPKRPRKGRIFVNHIFGNIDLKYCSPNITRGIYKWPKYKSGWSFVYWWFYDLKWSSQVGNLVNIIFWINFLSHLIILGPKKLWKPIFYIWSLMWPSKNFFWPFSFFLRYFMSKKSTGMQ